MIAVVMASGSFGSVKAPSARITSTPVASDRVPAVTIHVVGCEQHTIGQHPVDSVSQVHSDGRSTSGA
jgi:hypothetical protein